MTTEEPDNLLTREDKTKRKRPWYRTALAAILVVAALVALCFSFKYGLFGYSVTGAESDITQVPEVGSVFGELQTDGPIAYRLGYDRHQNLRYSIVGLTSKESLIGLCKALDLYFERFRDSMFDDEGPGVHEVEVGPLLEQIREAGGKRIPWGKGFTRDDYWFNGLNPKTGRLTGGAFREEDGLFFIFGFGSALNGKPDQ